MSDVLIYLKDFFPQLKVLHNSEIENYIIETVMGTPYDRASLKQIFDIVQHDYYPGLFQMNERKKMPAFLLEENKMSFEKWLLQKFSKEIMQLCQNELLATEINRIGIEKLTQYCMDVLNFKTKQNQLFADLIVNQEYSDIFLPNYHVFNYGNAILYLQ